MDEPVKVASRGCVLSSSRLLLVRRESNSVDGSRNGDRDD